MMVAVGVDGGGSRTAAVRADTGAAAYGPAANPSGRDVEASARALCDTVRAIEPALPVRVFAGVAGAGRAEIAAAIAAHMEGMLPAGSSVHVEGDTRIALRALVPEGPGIALVAGTGSFAYAESGERTALAGGGGYLVGDEGSGFAIGLAALRLYAKILDGRAHDREFAEAVGQAAEVETRDGLLDLVYERPGRIAAIASVAPAVIALGGAGHRAAAKIVQQASADLASLAQAAAAQAGLLESSPPIGLSGGLLRQNSLLSYLLETRIAAEIPGASIVRSADAAGAARAAAQFASRLLPA
jgi:glucosamine kinase